LALRLLIIVSLIIFLSLFLTSRNNYVGAAEIRHVLINIGEQVNSISIATERRISNCCFCVVKVDCKHAFNNFSPICTHILSLSQVTDDEVDEMIRMVDKDGDGQVC